MTIKTHFGSEPDESATFKYKEGVGFSIEHSDGRGDIVVISGNTFRVYTRDEGEVLWELDEDIYSYSETPSIWQASPSHLIWDNYISIAKEPITGLMAAAKTTQESVKIAGLDSKIKVTVKNGEKINNCFTNCTVYEFVFNESITVMIAIDEATMLPVSGNAVKGFGWEITNYKTSDVTISAPNPSDIKPAEEE